MTFATSSPGASQGGQGSTPPICQNCTTSTTPLWRRDESGSVLCNACGLFLKLHGRPRPISLKTDVIKSRNRQKTSGQPVKKKPSLFDSPNQHSMPDGDSPPMYHRPRPTHKPASLNGSVSPHSRHGTPLPQHSHIPPSSFFDSIISADSNLIGSPSLPALHLNQPSPGSSSSQLDRQSDLPQTYEALVALNNHLKTRVSELEVVNDIFRTRVSELENSEANARRSEITRREIEAQLRICLDEGEKREDGLKRKITDLEGELHEAREQNAHQRKKVRVSDLVSSEDTSAPSTPQSSS